MTVRLNGTGTSTRTPSETARARAVHVLVGGQILIGTAAWAALIAIQTKSSYDLHQGPLFMSAIALAWGAPTLLLSPVVGRTIDRMGPRGVGIGGAGVSIAACLGLILASSPAAVLTATLISGAARAFIQPAIDSMPSRLPGGVEHVKASIWLGFGTSVPIIAGPAAAAVFIAGWGTPSVFIFNAVAYLLGLLVFLRLRTTRAVDGSAPKDRTSGIRGLLGDRDLLFTLGMTLIVWISYGAFSPLEILYVKTVLERPASTFALIEITFGCGLILATLVIARFAGILQDSRFVSGSALLIGLSEGLYICSDRVAISFAGVFCWGVTAGLFGPGCRVRLLDATPPEQHGRAMALWRAVQSFGNLGPPVVSGVIASFAGIQPTLLGFAGTVLATGLATSLLSARRIPVARSAPAD